MVIQVTEKSPEVVNYFSNRVGNSGIVFEEVEYSFERLLNEKAIVEKQVFEKESLLLSVAEGTEEVLEVNVLGVGLSLRNNSISVYIEEEEENSKSLLNKEDIRKSLFSFENIVIVVQKASAKKLAVEEGNNEALGIRALTTLRPGQRINAAGSRSVGFWAKKTNGDIGIVTAPHDNLSSGTSVYLTDGTRFGSAQTPHFGGSVDAVFVKTTRTDLAISNKPAGYSFNLASETYRTLPEGATVYASGYVSGATSGVVSDTSFSTNVTGSNYTNYYFTDLVKVTMGTANGDSGGIVAGGGNSTLRYVVGIIQSGDNWGAETLYVKMPNISVALGILVY